MFKWLFTYWLNPTDTPYIQSKLNLWSFVNIRTFKIKITNIITYMILGLNNLKFKYIQVYYKNLSFEYVYIYNFIFLLGILLTLFIL